MVVINFAFSAVFKRQKVFLFNAFLQVWADKPLDICLEWHNCIFLKDFVLV